MDKVTAERIIKAIGELRTFIIQGPDTLLFEEFKKQFEEKMDELERLFNS